MANCSLSKNILKQTSCGYSLLKVVDLYLANYTEASAESAITVSGNEVTALASTLKWSHIEPAKDTASYTDELQVTDSGAKFRTHTLNFSVDAGNYDADLAEIVDDIALGRYTAIAKLANGKYVMLGRTTPLEATAANIAGAASASDSSAIAFTLVADTVEIALPLKDGVVPSVMDGNSGRSVNNAPTNPSGSGAYSNGGLGGDL